ncbi:uncharacterized protein LOC118425566 [Branchiostoma floridae]|uniref:Uncharacterized protein LOC118425566 n=1 Tax=Branchiostoma floridae TaxID=7739 RepID=A0A9J7LWE9_BRAFL|nr:uncharacterized protein LOC118425566 [Branchiostoma floridae]
MAEFPCGQCNQDADTSPSINCDQCDQWIHRKCVPMTPAIWAEWQTADLKFLCPRCVKPTTPGEGPYDIRAALKRVAEAAATTNINLRSVVKQERLLLKTYKVTLPQLTENHGAGEVDETSVGILRNFHPALLEDYRPIGVQGDGNCLYRAISQGMYGVQHHHHLIRLLTALEIAEHPAHHDIHHPNHVDHIKDSRLFLAEYNILLPEAAIEGKESCMQHIFAASAALGLCFESYCPPMVPSEYMSLPYTRRVSGRGVRTSKGVAFTLMWTSTSVANSSRQFK